MKKQLTMAQEIMKEHMKKVEENIRLKKLKG